MSESNQAQGLCSLCGWDHSEDEPCPPLRDTLPSNEKREPGYNCDPEPDPLRVSFPLVTGGLDAEIDVMGVCVQALQQLDDLGRSSVVTYLANRFGVMHVRVR